MTIKKISKDEEEDYKDWFKSKFEKGDNYSDEYDGPFYQKMEGCCGVAVLYFFPLNNLGRYSTWNSYKQNPIPKHWWENAIKETCENLKNETAYVQVILIQSQNKIFGPILKNVGFKLIDGPRVNNNTRNKLYTYFYFTGSKKQAKSNRKSAFRRR